MKLDEIKAKIEELEINKNTVLSLTYFENGVQVLRRGKISYDINGNPGIREDGSIGISVEMIKGGEFTPLAGFNVKDLINIELND